MLYGLMMDTALTTNLIMNFADKVHSQREIVSVSVDQGISRYSYGEAFARTRQLANALDAYGVNSGDRIATMAWNDHRHFELYFGISGIGCVCHTINPRLFPEQISYIIKHANDRLLFVDPLFLPLLNQLSDQLSSVEKIIVLCDQPYLQKVAPNAPELISYEAFIAPFSSEFDWPELDEKIASALCYTSGTTGNPKGVLYSHRSTVLHAYASALPDTLCLSASDCVMPLVPMFHVHAWGIPYSAPMVGAKLVLPGPKMVDGESLQQLIEAEAVSLSAGVPTVWLAVLEYLRKSGKTLATLQRVIIGGAACPEAIIDAYRNEYQVDIIPAWGMTETSPLGTVNKHFNTKAEQAYQGRPIFGIDLELHGADALPQAWDGKSLGEIRVRGPWVCSAYFNADTSDAHSDDGWFSTGDIGTIDNNSILHITDRAKDVIKSGGEWISSIDLENTVMAHSGVKEAAVIGIPHPIWTERPLLIVVKHADTALAADALLQWLHGRVAKWWIPESVVFVDELPHTATGKISKKDLREKYANNTL